MILVKTQNFALKVHDLVVNKLRLWSHLAVSDIDLHRLTTANSNYVYIVRNTNAKAVSGAEPTRLILRIYGKRNVMFDRSKEEISATLLAEVGLMPRFFAIFGNGRLEQYIDHTPVTAVLFRNPETYSGIAKKLKKVHDFIACVSSVSDGPIDDQMWPRLQTLQKFAMEAQGCLSLPGQVDAAHAKMFSDIVQWDVFKDHSAVRANALNSCSRMVFGHCDIHHGNVLNTKGGGMIIIDFEYSIPTTRGFDLANFFCEFGSDFDSPDESHEVNFTLYPDFKERKSIFRQYLGAEATEEELHNLELETAAYLPFVHLQWAHWGLIKAQESHGSSYDHLRYAYQRYEQWMITTAALK
jgi:thiamine kinase-like enzyme